MPIWLTAFFLGSHTHGDLTEYSNQISNSAQTILYPIVIKPDLRILQNQSSFLGEMMYAGPEAVDDISDAGIWRQGLGTLSP